MANMIEIIGLLVIVFTCIVGGYVFGNVKGKDQGIKIGRLSAIKELNRNSSHY